MYLGCENWKPGVSGLKDGRSNAGGRRGDYNKIFKSRKSLEMSVNGQDPVDVSRLITTPVSFPSSTIMHALQVS